MPAPEAPNLRTPVNYSALVSIIHSLLRAFKEDSIEENGRAYQDSFLFDSSRVGEVHFKSTGIGKEFDGCTLWFFENLAEMLRVAPVGTSDGWIKDPKGDLTTSAPTGISFGTTIHANSATAGRRM
jgi:hypothetical protein